MKKCLIFVSVFWLLAIDSNAAEITIKGRNITGHDGCSEYSIPLKLFAQLKGRVSGGCPSIDMFINGDIEGEDVKELQVFESMEIYVPRPVFIYLNSNGGSLKAAMEIGRILRNNHGSGIIVDENSKCLSACVYILAAGKDKFVDSSFVGVHRPRITEYEEKYLETDNLKIIYDKLYSESEKYFKDMNIHPDLVNLIWSTSSSSIKYLTQSELSFYRLLGKDLIEDEKYNLEIMNICGNAESVMHFKELKTMMDARCAGLGEKEMKCIKSLIDSHKGGECYIKYLKSIINGQWDIAE